MSAINFKDTDDYLESGKPPWPQLFLLYGEDVLYKKVLDKLLKALLGNSSRAMNYEPLDGSNENVPAALAAINTYSLLAEPKVVALTDARLFLSRQNEDRLWKQALDAARNDNMTRAARYFRDGLSLHHLKWEDLEGHNDWQALLGASPDGEDWSWARPVVAFCRQNGLTVPKASDPARALEESVKNGFPAGHHLIVTTPLIDKRRRLFKTLKEHGVVIDCSVPGGARQADRAAQAAALDSTVDDILKRCRKRMDREARQALYALTGFDLRTVAANVEKLVNYSGDRNIISRDDVRGILERTRRDPLYEFTDAVTDRNLGKSLFYLRSLLDSGEFDHPLPLLAAVANQVRRLIVAKDFVESPYGKVWHTGCAYPLFQRQVLPAIKSFDQKILTRLEGWQETLQPSPLAGDRTRRSKKRKTVSDLPMMGRARSPYPVYRTLIKTDRFRRHELLAALAAVSRADRKIKRSGPGGLLILEQVIIGICRPDRVDVR
ncbi:MAG: hypothetical protein JJV98_03290 [Desulfosarcina sp.]|nr:hypothetical protein [Desulfobacterales bacterium]